MFRIYTFIVLVFLARSTSSFASGTPLRENLRQCLNLLRLADPAEGTEQELALARRFREDLEQLYGADVSTAPFSTNLAGEELVRVLQTLGQSRLVNSQRGVGIKDHYDILKRVTGLAKRLFPNSNYVQENLEMWAVRGAVAYGIAALRQGTDSGFGAIILETAERMAKKGPMPSSGIRTFSLRYDDLTFLSEFSSENLSDDRGGARMVRAILHAVMDTLQIPPVANLDR